MREFALASVAVLLLSPGVALAQAAYNVTAGHQVRVYYAYAVNPDCTSVGQVVIRMTQAPQHGRITMRNGSAFPNFRSRMCAVSAIVAGCRQRKPTTRPTPAIPGLTARASKPSFPTGNIDRAPRASW